MRTQTSVISINRHGGDRRACAGGMGRRLRGADAHAIVRAEKRRAGRHRAGDRGRRLNLDGPEEQELQREGYITAITSREFMSASRAASTARSPSPISNGPGSTTSRS